MINSNNNRLSTTKACRALNVSESGYHEWRSRSPKRDDPKLIAEIHSIKSEFFFYGYRRVTPELKRRGYHVNSKKVLRLMRKEGLLVVKKRRTPKTTDSDHSLQRYPNLLIDLIATAINQAWAGDITYVLIGQTFAYLALIMDLFSRKIVGWELSWNPDRFLTLSALNKAVKLRGKDNLKGCIFHSDHGKQYLCNDYITRLEQLGMKPSMGEVGNSYDNAHIESLNKSIKYEAVYPNDFDSFEEAYEIIGAHVKLYNGRRLHSGIGYLPPDEFEMKTKVLNTARVS
jgi:putative transposase